MLLMLLQVIESMENAVFFATFVTYKYVVQGVTPYSCIPECTPFSREDGTFIISNVPSGSYVIEIVNPNCVYEPVRVEINSKGKFRARKVNLIQTSQVIQVPYPLKMRPLTLFRYFQVREQWKITDFLFNSMVRQLLY